MIRQARTTEYIKYSIIKLGQYYLNLNIYLMLINTAITVFMHSYRRDIAVVLLIKFVKGSISFLPNRGSSGVNAPN